MWQNEPESRKTEMEDEFTLFMDLPDRVDFQFSRLCRALNSVNFARHVFSPMEPEQEEVLLPIHLFEEGIRACG